MFAESVSIPPLYTIRLLMIAVFSVTPWNVSRSFLLVAEVSLILTLQFPHAMITRKLGAALAAGCTVVVSCCLPRVHRC